MTRLFVFPYNDDGKDLLLLNSFKLTRTIFAFWFQSKSNISLSRQVMTCSGYFRDLTPNSQREISVPQLVKKVDILRRGNFRTGLGCERRQTLSAVAFLRRK